MFDVFKEVVAELIVETINPSLGFSNDDRRKRSEKVGLVEMISNALHKLTKAY